MFIAHLGYCLIEGAVVGLATGLVANSKSRVRFALDIGLATTGAVFGGWFFSPAVANGGLGNLAGALFGAVFVAALGRVVTG